jgi:diguanylate cyclase (GGDEF)-like protein
MLDIDRFKNLNDTYGHQAGDSVLRALATQMRQEVRAVDYVARYGGEEFTIILPEMPASDAMTVAQRLRKNIAASAINMNEEQTANITVSIGVATFPEDATSREKLIAAADSALYAAKAAGRNKVLRAV